MNINSNNKHRFNVDHSGPFGPYGPWSSKKRKKQMKEEKEAIGVLWCQVSNGHIYSNNMNNIFIPCTVPMVELHIHKIDNTDKRVDSIGIRMQDGLSKIDGADFEGLSQAGKIKVLNKVVKVAVQGHYTRLETLNKKANY
tara:strand:+ start:5343 stop:5762 length:420 start_codon:yes stop_codon:yes gene_type:complete